MTLLHIPAHTVHFPDMFEDEATGITFSVEQDSCPEDPRDEVEAEHACVFVFNAPRGNCDREAPDNIAAQAFQRYFAEFDDAKSFELTKRYLAAFWPDEHFDLAMKTIRGYSQGDWMDVFAAIEPGYGTAESHIDQYRMWAFGDVWTVVPDGDTDLDALSGIYADDPEDAVKHYINEYLPKAA
ncbi:MAG TPA: hypothetical protein VFU07_05535 [Candidatus Lumbricidophila sp.]|nr:hypothetical protein [Candidatus Lumbricidophila sp.]